MVSLMTHPTQEWSNLQDVFYRKSDVYTLSWGLNDLSDYLIASAKHGGLLALCRDPNKLVSLGRAALLKPKIHVYTSAGQLCETIPWDPANRIVGFGFTSDEQLIVVLDEGVVRLYTFFSPCPTSLRTEQASTSALSEETRPIESSSSSFYTQHSLGQDATETGVVDVQVWSEGLIALTGSGSFVEWRAPSQDDKTFDVADSVSHPVVLPSLPTNSRPSSWTLIPSSASAAGVTQALISPADSSTLYSLDAVNGATDLRLSRGPFSSIIPSPNGKLLALVTSDKKLWVVSSDFRRSLSEFDITQCDAYIAPTGQESDNSVRQIGIRQIEWCGNNTVAIAWETEVVMVGPFGDSIRYQYPSSVHIISETDGLRVISTDRLEFVQKVSEASASVFLPGSTDPAALLFDSSEQYARKSAKADEGIRAIRRKLASAVETCLEAASSEWDVSWQRKLMRAAAFGKSFIDAFDPTSLVEKARSLRVLNAARRYEIGLPITYEQYQALGPISLIRRLTARNHHLLSLQMAGFLHLRTDDILKHWARGKIARSRGGIGMISAASTSADDETCRAIVQKFELQPSVSYADIARTAWNAGRTRLATMLLDYEPRAVDQVPLLLTMHEDKLALVKAIESGDTDLVYHVLLRLKAQLSRGDFFRLVQAPIADATAPGGEANGGIASKPLPSSHVYMASNLLELYAKHEDVELLQDFYYQDDRRTESALLALHRARKESELSGKVHFIKEAQRLFAEEKDRALEAKSAEEYVRLLGFQSALESEDGGRTQYVGKSLNETIRTCLVKGLPKKADKLRADWKVPDKRFWSIKISALVSTRDMSGLWSFANSKKSPIGYQPFIAQLIYAGHTKEALRYVPKCAADKSDKAKLRSYLQRIPVAIADEIAAQLGDS